MQGCYHFARRNACETRDKCSARSVCRRGSALEYINVNFVRSEPVGEAARKYSGPAGFFIKDTIEGEALRKSSEFHFRGSAFTAGGKHEYARAGLSHQNVNVCSSLYVQLDLGVACHGRWVQRRPRLQFVKDMLQYAIVVSPVPAQGL